MSIPDRLGAAAVQAIIDAPGVMRYEDGVVLWSGNCFEQIGEAIIRECVRINVEARRGNVPNLAD